MNRDSLAMVAVPLVAVACCLGVPILASVGVGAAVLVLGLGLPLALAMLLAVWVAVRRLRRMRRPPAATSAPATTPESASGLSTRR